MREFLDQSVLQLGFLSFLSASRNRENQSWTKKSGSGTVRLPPDIANRTPAHSWTRYPYRQTPEEKCRPPRRPRRSAGNTVFQNCPASPRHPKQRIASNSRYQPRRPREPLVVSKVSQSAPFSRFPRKNAHLQTLSIRRTAVGRGRPDADIPFDPRSCGSTSAVLLEAFNSLIATLELNRPKGIRQGRSRVDMVVPGGENQGLRRLAGREKVQAAIFFQGARFFCTSGRKRGQRREGKAASSSFYLANFALWRVPP